MIDAGKRDRKVAFYPRTTARDAGGIETETDGTPVQAWASVLFGTGADRREAGQAGANQAATFRVLSCAALRAATTRWEIDFLGERWGITSIAQVGGQAAEIDFTAVKRG